MRPLERRKKRTNGFKQEKENKQLQNTYYSVALTLSGLNFWESPTRAMQTGIANKKKTSEHHNVNQYPFWKH
jgi:hypothetical protein